MKKVLSKKDKVSKFFLENNKDLESVCIQFEMSLGDYSKEEVDFLISFKKQLKSPIKNQHYVPQFHLKQFENSEGRIETLSKKSGKILKSQSKKSICSDLYFYAGETGKPDILSQLIERQFQSIEDEFAKIYNDLISEILTDKQITQEHIYTLCLFVNNLHLRNKKFREYLEESHAEIIKKTSKMFHKTAKSQTTDDSKVISILENEGTEELLLNEEYDIKFSNNSIHLEFLLDEKNFFGFANLLEYQKIRFYIASGECNFVTSDNPVIEMNPGPIRGFYGYGYPERYHYFVLNPNILVEFSDPHKPGKKIKRQRIDNGRVGYFNLIRSAYSDFLYSHNKSDLQKDLFTIAGINYVDELFQLMPREFQEDKDLLDKQKQIAKNKGIDYQSNYDLFRKLGLLF